MVDASTTPSRRSRSVSRFEHERFRYRTFSVLDARFGTLRPFPSARSRVGGGLTAARLTWLAFSRCASVRAGARARREGGRDVRRGA